MAILVGPKIPPASLGHLNCQALYQHAQCLFVWFSFFGS